MKWFKIIRENSDLTQGKIAERRVISKFETGSAEPSPDTAKAIAVVLDFEWTKFLYEKQESEAREI
ncbi:helix-turn-helix transcriptional regulator [Clostridium sp. BNL1100]|uniref:helix-turn-helix domain-containing protein n=1 Tax=Clostridium sp. BNL1100 TaxID=755731 RepID=UPI00024A77AD|nr:helix-turn-helix transcriptional regulator [Clostridium sp. BNL1100]AEY64808.1 Helix-turn-helix protein [Clostridium sp. BNL1100]